MSDQIKHECGIALVRLLKPLDFYRDKYGSALYGLNKLALLMQKQYNRGQDGVGIANIKLDMPPGVRYISRKRNNDAEPVKALFEQVYSRFKDLSAEQISDTAWLKENMPYTGEVMMGHLRYGTHGGNSIEQCHPFHRQNNWITRNLLLCGNFNMTNVDELFNTLVELGQHPKEVSDTVTVMEKIGHFLDEEVEHLYAYYKHQGYSKAETTNYIAAKLNVQRVLERAAKDFDGGYAMAGLIGHGDAFVMRDPGGIRPAFYYADDEIIVAASERPAIQSVLNVNWKTIKEVKPGHALIIKKNGDLTEQQFIEPKPIITPCSFERIYFSRGNDRDIYSERKRLGELLAEPVMKALNYDFEHTVFSYIPNTAESAFYGLVKGAEDVLSRIKQEKIMALSQKGKAIDPDELQKILAMRARVEKLVNKDVKLRTFITQDNSRNELVSLVYDVTYGIVHDHVDTLVLMDDSIVRGTTLEKSILSIVERLKPKKVVVVSSAPQIRYPDCYGIDMAKIKDFIAFQALVALLKETKQENLMEYTYQMCLEQQKLPIHKIQNQVKSLYDMFDDETISRKISEIVKPKNATFEVEVIYQNIAGLHEACPNNHGDWYFSGNYPTPGGCKIANQAFIYFMEGKDKRAY
jgi:amidophosphoribosyltransferase